MTLHSDASEGAILNYLAGTSDLGDAAALRKIAALVGAMTGDGSPEGEVTAAVGSLYVDETTPGLYIKDSGSGDTGWVSFASLSAAEIKSLYEGNADTNAFTDAEKAQLAAAPGHNLLHNGKMQVHQRGTSVSGSTTGGYMTADRWNCGINTLGTWTQSVENDAPTGSGFRKSLKMYCSTDDASPAAGDYAFIVQTIEGQNLQAIKKGTANAEPVTLSFWTKSNKTGTYVAELRDADNGRAVSATYTVVSSGTWEEQSITFPADATGAFTNDNAASLDVAFFLAAGSDFTSGTLQTTWATLTSANRLVGQANLASASANYWQITGVQLEIGSAATGFEHKDYGTELAECQRYYYRMTPDTNTYYRFGSGQCFSGTAGEARVHHPVTMRGEPGSIDVSSTASHYAVLGASGGVVACSAAPTLGTASRHTSAVSFTVASGLAAGDSTALMANATTSGYIGFSADL